MLYAALTLAIAYPLLGAGYVFALDHAMGPESASFYARYLSHNTDPIQSKGGYALLLTFLDFVLPLDAAQKVLLFLPFFLAGLGMHRLAAQRVPAMAAVVGGVIYMLSPFAYVRGVAGQVGVLWAYALAPWFLSAWFRATETRDSRQLVLAVLLVSATAVFQAHGAFLLALIVVIHTAVRVARAPTSALASLRAPVLLAGMTLLVNAYWLLPVLFTPETTLTRITGGDRDFFATTTSGLPSVGLAALTLQGFWRQGYESFYAASPLWLLVPAAVLLFSIHGFRSSRDDRTLTLALVGGIGFVLGVGASSTLTAPLFNLAWDHVPLLKGFRDSHKFLALLALTYGSLAPVGVADALARLRATRWPTLARVGPVVLVAVLVAAPIASATPLLSGYHGQLGVAEYPREWWEAESATQDCTGSMMVLPWHLYLDLSWLPNPDKRVTNPAKLFFSCPTLTSDNVEAGKTASQSTVPAARYVEHWLTEAGFASGNPRNITTLGNLLAPANVQYVLVLKEADWRTQSASLSLQRDLALVLDNARVQVYENRAPIAPAWRTDRIVSLTALDDLIPLSVEGPLAGVVYSLGDEAAWPTQEGEATPVGLTKTRFGFEAAEMPGRYLLFTPPAKGAGVAWTFNGAPPAEFSLGVGQVFDQPGGGRVEDAGFWRVTVTTLAVSLASLGGLVWVAWRRVVVPL